jgi:hypothetical protein
MDTDDTIADPTDTAADAGGAVELALRLIPPTAWEGMFLLGKIATDPKAVRRHLRQLHDALAAVTAGRDKLAAERTAFDEYEQKTRAELTAQAAKLRAGQVELATAKDAREDRLAEREQRIRELEQAWGALRLPGDDNFPTFGGLTREPPRVSGLQKARFVEKHGRLPHADESLDAPVASEQPAGRMVVQAGRDGTSLAQTIETPEPVGARVRGRKPAPQPGPGAGAA